MNSEQTQQTTEEKKENLNRIKETPFAKIIEEIEKITEGHDGKNCDSQPLHVLLVGVEVKDKTEDSYSSSQTVAVVGCNEKLVDALVKNAEIDSNFEALIMQAAKQIAIRKMFS